MTFAITSKVHLPLAVLCQKAKTVNWFWPVMKVPNGSKWNGAEELVPGEDRSVFLQEDQ